MRKLIGFLVLVFVMLVPFRMVYLEIGRHSNAANVLLFMSILLGIFISVVLLGNKHAKE